MDRSLVHLFMLQFMECRDRKIHKRQIRSQNSMILNEVVSLTASDIPNHLRMKKFGANS